MFIWISLARFPITHVSQLKIACSTSNITAALVKKKFKHDSEYVIPNPRQRLVTLTKVSILQVTRPNSQLKFDESNA